MRVTLWRCDRCGLTFVAEEPPSTCPQCKRFHSKQVTIQLAGRQVEIASARIYGDNPLKRAALGLENLRLGCRCPHNWIISSLCPQCSVQP